MKKLLFIYYDLSRPGGITRVLTNLVNELVEYYEVTVLILVKNEFKFGKGRSIAKIVVGCKQFANRIKR